MRFGKSDVEILVKTRGQNEPFKILELSEICDPEEIPKYDNNLKWHKKKEIGNLKLAIEKPVTGKPPSMNPASSTHDISRENSLNLAPKKKPRTDKMNVDSDTEI